MGIRPRCRGAFAQRRRGHAFSPIFAPTVLLTETSARGRGGANQSGANQGGSRRPHVRGGFRGHGTSPVDGGNRLGRRDLSLPRFRYPCRPTPSRYGRRGRHPLRGPHTSTPAAGRGLRNACAGPHPASSRRRGTRRRRDRKPALADASTARQGPSDRAWRRAQRPRRCGQTGPATGGPRTGGRGGRRVPRAFPAVVSPRKALGRHAERALPVRRWLVRRRRARRGVALKNEGRGGRAAACCSAGMPGVVAPAAGAIKRGASCRRAGWRAIARSGGSSRRWMRVDVRTAARRSVPAGREGWGGNRSAACLC